MSTKWQDIAQEKRQAVNSLLPEKWKTTKLIPPVSELPDVTNYAATFLSEKEREITAQYTASELVGKLARREYTAVQVVEAFCHRATIAHELVRIPVRSSIFTVELIRVVRHFRSTVSARFSSHKLLPEPQNLTTICALTVSLLVLYTAFPSR